MSSVVNADDVEHRELSSQRTGEKFSSSAVLSEILGFKKIFVHHEVLLPGRRASSSHAHTHQEEMIYVLQGNPTAVVNGEAKDLKPGDFIGFSPASPVFHSLENHSSDTVQVLVIASHSADDRVIYSS